MYNKVAVILSAYNGEKYIEEQIDSIMEQSFTNFDLFIHDDGSNDCLLYTSLSICGNRNENRR